MSRMLDKVSADIYSSTKKAISHDLKGKTFNMELMTIEKKEWKTFRQKLAQAALTLIREINRSQKNYKRVSVDDLDTDFQKEGSFYYFDFMGENGSVRIVFQSRHNGYIEFSHIEEQIYEDVFSLF